MLTIYHGGQARDCTGVSRRGFLQAGLLGLGGLSLPALFQHRAHAADVGRDYVRDKSVIFLFLHGGPPQTELFDPKMSASEDVRSITGEVQTALPGITFGSTFTKLADRANRIAVVRSYASGNSGHSYGSVASGGNPLKAAMGPVYARLAGSNHPVTGMPTNVHVKPEAVQPGIKLGSNFETGALPTVVQPGELGASFSAFDPSGGGELRKSLELALPRERFEDRRSLLNELDTLKRQLDATKALDTVDAFQQQAYDVVLRGVADAFDLAKEDPKTVARYDTSGLYKLEEVTKWFDMKRASNQLGRQLLLARRLCEAGAGFVTVSDCGWDFHANNNSPKNMEGLPLLGGQVDHAVSAFLDDVRERGLEEKILLVVTGEMGRTPKRNKNGGRDHWGELTPLLLAGGGLKMGQVVGQSDGQAGRPATDKYTPANLLATVMDTVFDLGKLRLARGLPANLSRFIEESKPIAEVM